MKDKLSLVILFESRKKGKPFTIQRQENSNGKAICHCVQYRGQGTYFTTEAEAYAFAQGKGLLKVTENPHHIFGWHLKKEVEA